MYILCKVIEMLKIRANSIPNQTNAILWEDRTLYCAKPEAKSCWYKNKSWNTGQLLRLSSLNPLDGYSEYLKSTKMYNSI